MAIAYYNENNPYCVAWLRNLITAGLIAPGDVDDRSIADVCADDLRGYVQCHFFAGIGGWSYALRIAGWEDARPVWTGSCPCQPFSGSGKREGTRDRRHLWPEWFRLIRQREPAIMFGEQVASKDGYQWLASIQLELETQAYSFGAANLCAAGVGTDHQRQRLFFVANTERAGLAGSVKNRPLVCCGEDRASTERRDAGLRKRVHFRPDADAPVWTDGIPRPVGQVHAFGNAIVPQVAAEFIAAYMECRP